MQKKVAKSCEKYYYENDNLIRDSSWGDILIDTFSKKWLKYRNGKNPFIDEKFEYYKI
mgnify:FL=1